MSTNGERKGRALSTVGGGLGLCLVAGVGTYLYVSGVMDGHVHWLVWTCLAAVAGWIRLCWKAPHPWPVCALGFQALGLMCVMATAPVTTEAVLSLALILTTSGTLLSLLYGIFVALRPPHPSKPQENALKI